MAKKRNLLQRIPLAPVFAVLFGGAAAFLVAATPAWLFEQTVASSGLANVVSVAVPPLGIKARLLAIFAAFVFTGAAIWVVSAVVERLIAGPKPKPVRDDEDDDVFDLDGFAVPESTPRRPIFADRELGAPLMSDAALETARRDAAPDEPGHRDADVLELVTPVAEPVAPEPAIAAPAVASPVAWMPEPAPIAAGRPSLFSETPFEPVAEAPELAEPLVVEEFSLPEPPVDEPVQLPGESSIDALIRRLEAGLARRNTPREPDPSAPAAPVQSPRPVDWVVHRGDDNALDEDTTRALATLRRMVG